MYCKWQWEPRVSWESAFFIPGPSAFMVTGNHCHVQAVTADAKMRMPEMAHLVVQIGSLLKAPPPTWLPLTLEDAGPPGSPLHALVWLNAEGGDSACL